MGIISNKKIVHVEDAGHGGIDSGATGNGFMEKSLMLRFVLEIEKEIKRLQKYYPNFQIVLTRRTDEYLTLTQRTNIAKRVKAHSIASRHLDSFTNKQAKGQTVFEAPPYHDGANWQSNRFAVIQNKKFKELGLITQDRGVRNNNLHMTREPNKAKIPAILVENVFISNNSDIKFFVDNFDKFVKASVMTLCEFHGLEYIDDKNTIEKPKPKPVEPANDKINIVIMTEHSTVGGGLKGGTSYITIQKPKLIEEVLDKDFEPVDLRNVNIPVALILRNAGFVVDWDNDIRAVTADLASPFKPAEKTINTLFCGHRVVMNGLKVKGKYYLIVPEMNIAIEFRGFWEKLGYNVKWQGDDKPLVISK